MPIHPRRLSTVLAIPLATLLASCGDDASTGDTTPATVVSTVVSAPLTTAAPSPAGAPTTAAPTTGAAATGGYDIYGPPDTTAAPATTPPATTVLAATVPTATGGDVQLADSPIGRILVDGSGLTLYVFMADQNGTSSCDADCIAVWPALAADGDLAVGAGLDAAAFATTTRSDGTEQVTILGRPLYYYVGDVAPGDTRGQGIGDVWFVVGPDGSPTAG